jgi:hypothetical protein
MAECPAQHRRHALISRGMGNTSRFSTPTSPFDVSESIFSVKSCSWNMLYIPNRALETESADLRQTPPISVRRISRQLGRVQYPAVEYHFHDPGIGVDCLRRILPEQQQIGALSNLHGADVPIQLQRLCVRQRR